MRFFLQISQDYKYYEQEYGRIHLRGNQIGVIGGEIYAVLRGISGAAAVQQASDPADTLGQSQIRDEKIRRFQKAGVPALNETNACQRSKE